MTLDELAFLLWPALAAVAWYGTAYRQFNSTNLTSAVAATSPMLRD
jgi:hypothetical protein